MSAATPQIESMQRIESGARTIAASDQPSILIVGTFLSQSNGNRSVCEDLAQRLPSYGWPVHTTSAKPGRVSRMIDMLTTVWSERRNYTLAQVDVYSGPAFYWAASVCGLLSLLRKPYILTLHGGNLPEFSRKRVWLVHKVLQSAAVVTAPSRYLSEQMNRFRHDIQVLPNAISLSRYPFEERKASRQRLVWLRAFHQIYEPQLAVRVLAELKTSFPQLTLIMVGPDKGDGSLQQTQALAQELGVADRVRFEGRVPKDEIALWINSGDLFLNTSTIDNTPVTVLEAMACGACVVTTEVGGIPYLCDHRADAMLSPVGDVKAMAANVAQLLGQPKLASTISRNARSRVELLDWAAILPRWTSLFRFVSNRRTRAVGSEVNS